MAATRWTGPDDLEGRVAVVTGAASGIGRALASAFAAEGMHVAVADVEAEPLDETADMVRGHGVEALVVPTDVSDAAQVEHLAGATMDRFGALHVACNNAGVSGGGLTWEIPVDTWDWILGVNFFGVLHGVRSFTPRIVASGGGHLVNTASMAGLTSPPGMSPYNVSKHGVVTLSETMAQELAMVHPEVGISVLCPGWVRTRIHEADRNRPGEGDVPDLAGTSPPAEMEGLREMVAGLIAGGLDPAEVATIVLDAVRTRRFWVTTHPEWMSMVTVRATSIVEGRGPVNAMLPPE